MISEFQSLDELENAIIEDKKDYSISSNRFPIRFIFLNSNDELKKLTKMLTRKETKLEELSSLLDFDNSWFTSNDIIEKFKKIKTTSLIVSLSDYIRFLSDDKFLEVINTISQIENNKIKIYVPLIGLWERFNNIFWNDFYRKKYWAPVWKLNTEPKKVKIYQINFDLNTIQKKENIELISTTKEWLNLWKKDNITTLISSVKPLSAYFKNSLPDQTFSQELLKTPKEYISKILGVDIDIEYKKEEKDYWDEMLKELSDENNIYHSFVDFFNHKFNKNDAEELDSTEYIELYLENNNNKYKKWLVKNFFLNLKKYQNSYLHHCFESLENSYNKSLTKKIFLEIFDIESSESFLEERKKLLKFLNKKQVNIRDDNFENKYRNIENLSYKQKLKFLTCSTTSEKQKIIDIVRENGIENTITYVKEIYPELAYYLDWNIDLDSIDPWIIDYFQEYNKSKILNEKSEKLNNILNEKNNPLKIYDWYYETKHSKLIDKKEYYTVWIDGLGAEWMPLLINLLNKYGEDYGKEISYKSINSVNLPSATKFNKKEYDEKISKMDEYIHHNYYKYSTSLIEEIELVKEIAKKIVSINQPKISIISDHGFSFLCTRNFGCSKKYDCKNAEHGGRYVLWDKKGNNSDDYIYVETENEDCDKKIYRVASKHTSLHNTPPYEVHGGATPEELLVPHIILENNDDIINYNVSSELSKINISYDSKVPIHINPYPKTLPIATHQNKKLKIVEEGEGNYFIELDSNIEKGEQIIEIKINDKPVEKLEIIVEKGGMKSNDDDWF